MPYNRKAFGVVISKLRVQKGLTQESLSGLAGIARSHLAALESGKKPQSWILSGGSRTHWE